jgi:hypothetical protein
MMLFYDGKSLLPLVRHPGEKVREVFLGEHGEDGERAFMLTEGSWKYLWYEMDGAKLFFHIAEDPNECHDLAESQPELIGEWREQLVNILAARLDDPAVYNSRLAPKQSGRQLTGQEKAKLLTDYNVRGIH